MERIKSALALCEGNTLAVVLWHQGESDVPLTMWTGFAALHHAFE